MFNNAANIVIFLLFFPTWKCAFIFKNNQEVRGDESFMGKVGFKVQITGLKLYFSTHYVANYKIIQVYYLNMSYDLLKKLSHVTKIVH